MNTVSDIFTHFMCISLNTLGNQLCTTTRGMGSRAVWTLPANVKTCEFELPCQLKQLFLLGVERVVSSH